MIALSGRASSDALNLIRIGQLSADAGIRSHAARALANQKGSLAVTYLKYAVKDSNYSVRVAAIDSFQNRNDSASLEIIKHLQTSENMYYPNDFFQATALKGRRDTSSLELTKALARSDYAPTRKAVAEALDGRTGEGVMSTLLSLSNDTDEEVRAAAVRSLGPFASSIPKNVMEKALSDVSPEVRVHALAIAYETSENKEVILRKALQSTDPATIRASHVSAYQNCTYETLSKVFVEK